MICNKCGSSINDNLDFCPMCGSNIQRGMIGPQPMGPGPMPGQPPMGPVPMPGQPPMGLGPMPGQPPMGPGPMPGQPPMGPGPMPGQPPMGPGPMPGQPPMGPGPMPGQPPMGPGPMPGQPPMGPGPMPGQPPMGPGPMPVQPPMGLGPMQNKQQGSGPVAPIAIQQTEVEKKVEAPNVNPNPVFNQPLNNNEPTGKPNINPNPVAVQSNTVPVNNGQVPNYMPPTNNGAIPQPVVKSKKKFPVAIVAILGVLLVVLIAVLVLLISKRFSSSDGNGDPDTRESRTIMIYLCGSTLETDAGIASADLKAIKGSQIDLTKTNVIVYAGGAKRWYNGFQTTENAIYKLTTNGYEKVKSYSRTSMGDPTNLTTFIDYATDNYEADIYNLMIWDHGGGFFGAVNDDFFPMDTLQLKEMSSALKNTKMNRDKRKFEAVVFRTCLNGTIEVAKTFAPYAKYLAASEEVTYGSAYTETLSFINTLSLDDNGEEFGKKFIQNYKKSLDVLDNKYGQSIQSTNVTTYAVIDLSKVSKIESEMDKFYGSLDVNNDYSKIASARSQVYQFASDADVSYDSVDLKYVTTLIGQNTGKNSKGLTDAIDDAVVYNWSNDRNCNGLSVYFPYRGASNIRTAAVQMYNNMDLSKKYASFIKKFNSVTPSSHSYSFESDTKTIKVNSDSVEITLTDNDLETYGKATYTYYVANKDNTLTPVYTGDVVKSNSVIKASLPDKLYKANNQYINIINKNNRLFTYGKLDDKDVVIYIKNDKISSVMKKDDSNGASGIIYDVTKSTNLTLNNYKYVNNKNVLGKSSALDSKLSTSNLDINTDKIKPAYIAFTIEDVYNQTYQTKLIKLS